MALVKFVEDDHVHARKPRIGNQSARQNAFGEESEAGAWAGDFFKTDLIADGPAYRFPTFLRNPSRGQASGQTPGLQDQHLSVDQRK